jgi:hypothetical protein
MRELRSCLLYTTGLGPSWSWVGSHSASPASMPSGMNQAQLQLLTSLARLHPLLVVLVCRWIDAASWGAAWGRREVVETMVAAQVGGWVGGCGALGYAACGAGSIHALHCLVIIQVDEHLPHSVSLACLAAPGYACGQDLGLQQPPACCSGRV